MNKTFWNVTVALSSTQHVGDPNPFAVIKVISPGSERPSDDWLLQAFAWAGLKQGRTPDFYPVKVDEFDRPVEVSFKDGGAEAWVFKVSAEIDVN